ncbi:unnamed protein product [Hermetia illucens]|uniref:Uncharacterized protein n=1 Tax=Hermetia illucens TaxID=343691 RepID=A0A7R8YYB5_HERIL|nr:unnamed protein product [Hermetia illucens]
MAPVLSDEQTEELKTHILKAKESQNGKYTISGDNLFIGLSKIVREINRNTDVYFFLSTDIKPKFVATQIINLTLSKHKSCKVLCVPNLKALTKFLFGIESIAFGYRSGQCPLVEKWITDTQASSFPVSERILRYYSQSMNSVDNKNIKEPIRKNINKPEDVVHVESLFLKRKTNSQRAFTPQSADNSKPLELDQLEPEPAEWADFISLSVKPKSKVEQMEIDGDDEDDIELEKRKLSDTIKKFFSKSSNGKVEKGTPDPGSGVQPNGKRHKKSKKHKKLPNESSHFEYVGLTVNRIQPNPDKLKKKKKKK